MTLTKIRDLSVVAAAVGVVAVCWHEVSQTIAYKVKMRGRK